MINLKITIAEKLQKRTLKYRTLNCNSRKIRKLRTLKDIDQNELNDKTNNLQNLYFSILIYELKKTL